MPHPLTYHENTWKGQQTFQNGVDITGGILTGGNVGYKGYGKEYFLDPTHGSNGNTGLAPDKAFATLPVAYAALTANQNDVLYYLSGSTSLSMAATVTWAKAYTHFIGIGAPTFMAQRTRIFHSANFSPMFTISASGCSFQNLYMSYGRGGADNHIVITLTGGRNFFNNCHFALANHATEAADAASRGIVITGTEGEHFFKHCTFGNDTIARAGANASVEFTGGSPRNLFEDCIFSMHTSAATPKHVLCSATGIDRFALFRRCWFYSTGTAITQAIDSNITDTTARRIFLHDCVTQGATDVADATGDGTIWMNTHTETANVNGLATNVAVA